MTVTKEDLKTVESELVQTCIDLLLSEPLTTHAQIAKRLGMSRRWVVKVAVKYNVRRPRGRQAVR